MNVEITIPSTTSIRGMLADLETETQKVVQQYRDQHTSDPHDDVLEANYLDLKEFEERAENLQRFFNNNFNTLPTHNVHKIYHGWRTPQGASVTVTEDHGQSDTTRPLDPRLDLYNHSPGGMEWGYQGSGPAQLGLAILADFTRDDRYAVRRHQEFKRHAVANIPHQMWTIYGEQVEGWVKDNP